ncbi:MAG: hypothetical protein Fur0046_19650 [Cyanobacteria bacterium J069]|nr:MAG: hypothetical protein D6742_11365 [Cyanobacteria bacterium J069]
MTHPARDPAILDAVALLIGYGFDLDGFAADYLVSYWAVNHPAHWIRAAIVEALYQGRYRAVSVGQILAVWRRRGQPILHYTPDFERVVSGRFGGFAVSTIAATEGRVRDGSPPESPSHSAPTSASAAQVSPNQETGDLPQETDQSQSESAESSQEPSASSVKGEELSGLPDGSSQHANPSEHASVSERNPGVQLEADFEAAAKDYTDNDSELDSSTWWNRGSAAQNPIHQYVPIIPRIEASAFYAKLRAVACGRDETGEAGAVLVADGHTLAKPAILRNSPLLGSMEQANLGEQN